MIDWTLSDKFDEMICECTNGHTFMSHVKSAFIDGTSHMGIVSRKPCPECGVCPTCKLAHLRSARSGVLRETL